MRDVNRIPKVIKKLESAWLKHPDLRFFQFLTILTKNYEKDLFYLEESELEKIIEDFVSK